MKYVFQLFSTSHFSNMFLKKCKHDFQIRQEQFISLLIRNGVSSVTSLFITCEIMDNTSSINLLIRFEKYLSLTSTNYKELCLRIIIVFLTF